MSAAGTDRRTDVAGGSGSRGPLLMVGSALAWAAGLVLTKAVLDRSGAPPIPVLSVQLSASVVFLAAGVALTRTRIRVAIARGWVGLLEPGLAYLLALGGLAMTSASNASVLGSLEPVLVPLLVLVLFRHRPGRRLGLVVAASTVGSVLVSVSGTSGGGSDWRGDLLIVASVAAAALYVVLASVQVVGLPPLAAALGQQLWALAVVGLLVTGSVAAGAGTGWPDPRPLDLLLAVASGVLNYALPFWLYLVALTRMPVARAAAYLTLIPVFGVALAALALGERVTPLHLVGGAFVIAALLYDAQGTVGRADPALADLDTEVTSHDRSEPEP